MHFYIVTIYWEDGDGIKSTFYFRERNNALAYCEEWIKNNFHSESYHLSEDYESLEECLTSWNDYKRIEWAIDFYEETINFED